MADLIVVLDGTRVVEVGSHQELMAAAEQYAGANAGAISAMGKTSGVSNRSRCNQFSSYPPTPDLASNRRRRNGTARLPSNFGR